MKGRYYERRGGNISVSRKQMEIGSMDKEIAKLCKKYRTTDILRQVKGIGPEISLAFVLLVGAPRRFRNAGALASYFGLVPRQDQSGNTDKQVGITKSGNSTMRTMLIQGAQYIMGPFGEDSELRDFGNRIEARGGKIAKRKARVAVARKIVTLFYALLTHPDIPYSTHYKRGQKTNALREPQMAFMTANRSKTKQLFSDRHASIFLNSIFLQMNA